VRKVVSAGELGSTEDGETILFVFEFDDGSMEAFESSHGAMVEVSNVLLRATKECARKRDRLGKKWEPVPNDGVVRTFDLSTFAAFKGIDGVPRIAHTQNDGSTAVIRLTRDDAARWLSLLKQVVDDDLAEDH
jgi:hypothetical protein